MCRSARMKIIGEWKRTRAEKWSDDNWYQFIKLCLVCLNLLVMSSQKFDG